MAKKVQCVSVIFDEAGIDRASVTFGESVKVNGEWISKDDKAVTVETEDATVFFEYNGKQFELTVDVDAVFEMAKKMATRELVWKKHTPTDGSDVFWYAYSSEAERLEVECNVPKGLWTLKVGLKAFKDPAKYDLTGQRRVTGLINYRPSKPMMV